MAVHRVLAQHERKCDVSVGEPGGDEPHHLGLATRERRVVAGNRRRGVVEETVQGAHVLALITLGLRSMYGKKEIHRLEDIKGLKIRVQATATEDATFAAYGAQTVHMPFGSVYTSLQTDRKSVV